MIASRTIVTSDSRIEPKLRSLRCLVGTAVIFLGASSCTTVPSEPPNLWGTYRFALRNYDGDRPVRSMPLLPLRYLQDGSTVRLSLSPERAIVVEYTDSGGAPCISVTSLASEAVSWDEDSLVVREKPPRGVPIAPGLALERVWVELRRESDGCLEFEWSYREYGLALFILPFVDAYSGRLVLEPIALGP